MPRGAQEADPGARRSDHGLVLAVADPLFLGPLGPDDALKVAGKAVGRSAAEQRATKIITTTLRNDARTQAVRQTGRLAAQGEKEPAPWLFSQTLARTRQRAGELLRQKLAVEITGPVRFFSRATGASANGFRRATGLEARLFMRADAKVLVRLDGLARRPLVKRFFADAVADAVADAAADAAIDTALATGYGPSKTWPELGPNLTTARRWAGSRHGALTARTIEIHPNLQPTIEMPEPTRPIISPDAAPRKVYRFGLDGVPAAGKTCLLAALGMNRKPNPSGYDAVRLPCSLPAPAGDPQDWPADAPTAAAHRGEQWLDQAVDALRAGQVPPANPVSLGLMTF